MRLWCGRYAGARIYVAFGYAFWGCFRPLLPLAKLAQRLASVRFNAKWHLPYLQSHPARAVFYASFQRLRASPRRHVAYTDQNVFDLARALSLCAARSVSRLTGAHRSPIFARNISPALSTTTDTEPKEYT